MIPTYLFYNRTKQKTKYYQQSDNHEPKTSPNAVYYTICTSITVIQKQKGRTYTYVSDSTYNCC